VEDLLFFLPQGTLIVLEYYPFSFFPAVERSGEIFLFFFLAYGNWLGGRRRHPNFPPPSFFPFSSLFPRHVAMRARENASTFSTLPPPPQGHVKCEAHV